MSRPTLGRTTVPVAFSMTSRDREVLDDLTSETGLAKSEIMRRLLYAYHSGATIPGLPRIRPPRTQQETTEDAPDSG